MSKKLLPLNAVIGGRVRERRMLLGLSQRDLAEAIGVTYQQIQKYEKGKSRMDAARLSMLTDALSVPGEWFFVGLDAAPIDRIQTIWAEYGRQHLTLLRGWQRITDRNTRASLLDLVEAVAAQDECQRLSLH